MRRIYLHKVKSEVARSNTIRHINKRIVLNYVREREPISRAEIAKETALQRSTVSSLVTSLVDEGLIEETGAGASSGGRKPTMLRLRRNQPIAVGVDITPTVTTVAVADLAGTILEQETFATSPDKNETLARVAASLLKFKPKLAGDSIEIGVSVPGLVDETSGTVTYVPYFKWKDWNLKHKLQEQIGFPAIVDNDANAIALAESWFGTPEVRGVKNFVSVLVAEGIGTGIIFDGQIYRGNKGAGGEFGHMFIGENNNVRCSCGNTQCWEAFASNTATVSRYAALAQTEKCEIDCVFSRAQEGERSAAIVVNQTAKYLALGIVNLIVGLSPEAIIIGGKIGSIWSIVEPQLLATINQNIKQKLPKTNIIISTLGNSPTLTGAIGLSLIKKFAQTV